MKTEYCHECGQQKPRQGGGLKPSLDHAVLSAKNKVKGRQSSFQQRSKNMTQFTKEEIFQMAQEAGGTFDHMMWLNRDLLPVFERFAEIVCVKQHKKKLVQMEDSWMVCREKIAEFERKIKEDRYMLGSNVTAPVQQVGTIGHIGNGPTTLTAAIAPLLAEQPAQQSAERGEPVAWGNLANWCLDSDRVLITDKDDAAKYHRDVYDLTPLYTTPQAQPRGEATLARESLTLPPGRCASEWGGRATGPCLYTDDEVFEILAAHGINAKGGVE